MAPLDDGLRTTGYAERQMVDGLTGLRAGVESQATAWSRMMRVLVIDDHDLFRVGLRLLLQSLDPEMEVALTSTIEEATGMAAGGGFDLILMDWHLEGVSGADGLVALREASPHSRVVVLSGEKSASLIRSVVDLGAVGFIPKDVTPERLMQALQTIAGGGIYLPATVLSGPGSPAPKAASGSALRDITLAFPGLTQRQGEVLTATLRGLPNKLIARELGISDGTVKTHLSVIYRELGVQSRTEAVYACARHGVRIS
jgi:two-component system nitrate/nitrite response regulator NarL